MGNAALYWVMQKIDVSLGTTEVSKGGFIPRASAISLILSDLQMKKSIVEILPKIKDQFSSLSDGCYLFLLINLSASNDSITTQLSYSLALSL